MSVLHIRRTLACLIFVSVCLGAGSAVWGQTKTFYTIRTTVNIGEHTRDDLLTWLDSNGGYFVRNANDVLEARIPVAQVQGFKSVLETYSRSVLSYSLSSVSIDQEYLATQAAVVSREEILKASIGYIPSANVKGTLALERETASIIEEIEGYKGRLRVLENQAAFASVTIQLQAPPARGPAALSSTFGWLSELDFYSFMEKSFE